RTTPADDHARNRQPPTSPRAVRAFDPAAGAQAQDDRDDPQNYSRHAKERRTRHGAEPDHKRGDRHSVGGPGSLPEEVRRWRRRNCGHGGMLRPVGRPSSLRYTRNVAVSQIKMPQLGESVTEGTVDKWLKHEGDFVKRDEPLVEVVTDKVNAEIPSPFEGKLVKITATEGEVVRVGAVIAQIEVAGAGTVAAASSPGRGATEAPTPSPAPAAAPASAQAQPAPA